MLVLPLCVQYWQFDDWIVSHECQDQLPELGMVPGGQNGHHFLL